MADEPAVVSEQVILLDERGEVTEDSDRAVRGEALRTFADGHTESTLFVVDRSGSQPRDLR